MTIALVMVSQCPVASSKSFDMTLTMDISGVSVLLSP